MHIFAKLFAVLSLLVVVRALPAGELRKQNLIFIVRPSPQFIQPLRRRPWKPTVVRPRLTALLPTPVLACRWIKPLPMVRVFPRFDVCDCKRVKAQDRGPPQVSGASEALYMLISALNFVPFSPSLPIYRQLMYTIVYEGCNQ